MNKAATYGMLISGTLESVDCRVSYKILLDMGTTCSF